MASETQKHLFSTYGPLISLDNLAEVFDRSPQGLRVSLCGESPFSRAINDAKIKYGRRIYFKSSVIAKLIDDDCWSQNEQ